MICYLAVFINFTVVLLGSMEAVVDGLNSELLVCIMATKNKIPTKSSCFDMLVHSVIGQTLVKLVPIK